MPADRLLQMLLQTPSRSRLLCTLACIAVVCILAYSSEVQQLLRGRRLWHAAASGICCCDSNCVRAGNTAWTLPLLVQFDAIYCILLVLLQWKPTRASAPKSSTSPPRKTMRCRNSRPKGSPAMSAVLGARMGCPFASIHGLSLPLLSKPAGRPMIAAWTRVAGRLWLPLLKALGLLLLLAVVLLHACWHGAFKADICRSAKTKCRQLTMRSDAEDVIVTSARDAQRSI